MRTILTNDLVEVLLDEPRRLVVIRRTQTPPRVEDIGPMFAEVTRALGGIHRGAWALLMDLRKAPMNNGAGFEQAMNQHIPMFTAGFARTAILIATAVGRLQVTRVARERGRAANPFDDEQAALAWLAEREP